MDNVENNSNIALLGMQSQQNQSPSNQGNSDAKSVFQQFFICRKTSAEKSENQLKKPDVSEMRVVINDLSSCLEIIKKIQAMDSPSAQKYKSAIELTQARIKTEQAYLQAIVDGNSKAFGAQSFISNIIRMREDQAWNYLAKNTTIDEATKIKVNGSVSTMWLIFGILALVVIFKNKIQGFDNQKIKENADNFSKNIVKKIDNFITKKRNKE